MSEIVVFINITFLCLVFAPPIISEVAFLFYVNFCYN